MNVQELVGHKVNHKSLGEGRITKTEEKYIWVAFNKVGEKKFQFPKAFVSFLTLDDGELQNEILAEEKRRSEEEMALKDAVIKTSIEKTVSMAHAKKSKDSSDKVFNGHLLEPGITFNTHADVFNKCFGYNYKHFQMAYKDIGRGYAVWFPSIAKRGLEGYVSTDEYTGWKNILQDGNKKLIQVDKEKNTGNKDPDLNKRLVFAKFDSGQGYRFIGVYGSEKRVDEGFEYTRLGTKFDIDSFRIIDEE